MGNNPYQVLGVSPMSTKDEARKKFRALSKMYHPDNLKTGNREKFSEVLDAWEYLDSQGDKAFGNKSSSWSHVTLFNIKKA